MGRSEAAVRLLLLLYTEEHRYYIAQKSLFLFLLLLLLIHQFFMCVSGAYSASCVNTVTYEPRVTTTNILLLLPCPQTRPPLHQEDSQSHKLKVHLHLPVWPSSLLKPDAAGYSNSHDLESVFYGSSFLYFFWFCSFMLFLFSVSILFDIDQKRSTWTQLRLKMGENE